MTTQIEKNKVCKNCSKKYSGNFPTCFECKSRKVCKTCPKLILEKYSYCFECNNPSKKKLESFDGNTVTVRLPKVDIINGFLNKKFSPMCYHCLKYCLKSYSYLSGQYTHREYKSTDDIDFVYLHETCYSRLGSPKTIAILEDYTFTVLKEEAFEITD